MKPRRAALAFVLAGLTGCASPLLEISDRDVGLVLQPISQSNIHDTRAEFRQVFCAVNEDHGRDLPDFRECDEALHRLVDEGPPPEGEVPLVLRNRLRVFVIPGIFGECLRASVSPFSHAIEHLGVHGVRAEPVPGIRGRASSPHNAQAIHDFLLGVELAEDEKLVVVSYSKGTTDTLFYLGDEEYASSYEKIDALVSVAGVVNGTPVADDANSLLKDMAENFPLDECPTQDGSGIEDLTRREQLLRLSSQTRPDHIRYYSLPAYSDGEHVSTVLKNSYDRLSLVDPRNDSQVIYYDSVIPGSQLLGYANADHWAVSLPFERNKPLSGVLHRSIGAGTDQNAYPREVLLESIVRWVDMDL